MFLLKFSIVSHFSIYHLYFTFQWTASLYARLVHVFRSQNRSFSQFYASLHQDAQNYDFLRQTPKICFCQEISQIVSQSYQDEPINPKFLTKIQWFCLCQYLTLPSQCLFLTNHIFPSSLYPILVSEKHREINTLLVHLAADLLLKWIIIYIVFSHFERENQPQQHPPFHTIEHWQLPYFFPIKILYNSFILKNQPPFVLVQTNPGQGLLYHPPCCSHSQQNQKKPMNIGAVGTVTNFLIQVQMKNCHEDIELSYYS